VLGKTTAELILLNRFGFTGNDREAKKS